MQCFRYECGGTGEWHPVLYFHAPAEYDPSPAIPAILGLVLCGSCMDAAKLEDFVSAELNELMERVVGGMGFVKPDPSRTTLGRHRLFSEDGKLDVNLGNNEKK